MLEQLQKIGVLFMEQSSIQGVNQQVTQVELAYLAGLWDGEGSFALNKSKSHGKPSLLGKSVIVNTDINIINKVVTILDKMGVTGYLQMIRHRNPIHKDGFVVSVNQLAKNKILLKTIIPYLVGKKAQAELLLRYINRRLQIQENKKPIPIQGSEGKMIGCIRKDGYDTEDISLYEQLKRLNTKGNLNELTLPRPNKGRMISSELTGDRKNTAEMTVSVSN